MRYLIDTNALSELAKDTPEPAVFTWFAEHQSDELVISAITVGEIAYGIARQKDGRAKAELQDWFESMLLEWFADRVIALNSAVMLVWANIKARSRTLPVMDSLIAACAIASQSALVTRNIRDYEGIENLTLINPWLDGGTNA